jgi:hypothetical protein
MPDEDHGARPGRAGVAGVRPGHAPAAVRGLADAELEQVAGLGQVLRGCGHAIMIPWLRAGRAAGALAGLAPLRSR